MSLICRPPWTGARVVFDGQSLNNRGAMPGPDPRPDPFPNRLMRGLGDVAVWINKAEGGGSWTLRLNGQEDPYVEAAETRLYPQVDCSASKLILSMCGGTSDILYEGDNAATVMANMVEYADLARAAGFTHVITYTITPTTFFSPEQEDVRQELNADYLLADNGANFDEVVDWTATALETVSATHYHDLLHFSVDGADLAADTARPQLSSLIAA